MKDLTELQMATLRLISKYSRAKAITGKEIARFIGLKPRSTGKEGADMRSVIHALRSKGYPICATGNGYWYASTSQELIKYIVSFQARIDKQQEAVDALQKSFSNVGKDFTAPPAPTKPWKAPTTPSDERKITLFDLIKK